MNYPVEKHGIRIYCYYYHKIEKPIKIEARTKQEARTILDSIFNTLPQQYKQSKIVGETVVIPLKGISEKIVNGIKYVWVGEDIARGGWLDENTYEKMISQK